MATHSLVAVVGLVLTFYGYMQVAIGLGILYVVMVGVGSYYKVDDAL